MAMLEVKDLEVYYGMIQAIKGISFEVNQGEVVALIGANGAGKTTTLHTITGLLPSKKGTVTFEGQDITKVPAHKIVYMGSRTRTGRTSCIRRSERIPESEKWVHTQEKDKEEIEQTLAMVYERFPSFERKKRPESRNTLRWRAADAGNGTGAYVKTETDRHGRAFHGTFTNLCKRDL